MIWIYAMISASHEGMSSSQLTLRPLFVSSDSAGSRRSAESCVSAGLVKSELCSVDIGWRLTKKSLSTCCDIDEYGSVMCTSGLLLQFACGDLDVCLLVGMRRFDPCWRLSHAWMTSSWTFVFHLLHKTLFTLRCVAVGKELLFTHDTKMHRIPEIRARWESSTPVSELRYDLGDVNTHSEC